ncbi:MAG: NUDIX hydrolase [Acidimicrobiales bacterium]
MSEPSFLTGRGETPVVHAATVVLLRDVDGSVETLMLRKTQGQAFGGMWVFPGGRVERGDGEAETGALAAAVREAAEETGLVLAPGDLVPFAHWTPPPEAPRRFATWFFVAKLPPGLADVVVDGGEIGDHVWTAPALALERHAAGEIELAPPTWVTMHRLCEFTDGAAAVGALRQRPVEYFATRILSSEGSVFAVWEPDAAYVTGDVDTPGARHRLAMVKGGWRYERT